MKRGCSYLGCVAIIERGAFCEHHGGREFARDDNRGNAYQRGYGGDRWKRIRRIILNRDPICMACGVEAATVADHITPKRKGGKDTLENLQGLCASCHSAKTARGG